MIAEDKAIRQLAANDALARSRASRKSTVRDFIRFYRSPWIWGTHLVGFLIALYGPPFVALQPVWVQAFMHGMGSVFPVVDNYASRSAFPDTTRLYFSFMFAIGPIWFVRFLTRPAILVNRNLTIAKWRDKPYLPYLVIVILIPMCLALSFLEAFVNPGYDFSVVPINSSKFCLGLFGPIFSIGPYALLAAPILLVNYLRDFFKQKN